MAAADRTTTLWADAAFPWLQVFTAIAEDRKDEVGIAVEPMSCPADAFNSGDGLVVLEPGEEWTGTWGISPARGAGPRTPSVVPGLSRAGESVSGGSH